LLKKFCKDKTFFPIEQKKIHPPIDQPVVRPIRTKYGPARRSYPDNSLLLAAAIVHPASVHLLLYASLGHEAVLHCRQQLVEHIGSLVNKRNAQVGQLLVVHALQGQGIVGPNPFASGILPHLLVARMVRIPLRQVAHPQIVLIVNKQLLQTGLGHIGELNFGLGGGSGGLVALGNVLFAAAGSLHHLVDGAVALGEVVLGEIEGDVVDNLGNLIHPQVAVVPMLGQKGNGRRLRGVDTLRIWSNRSILNNLITLIILITQITLIIQIILIG